MNELAVLKWQAVRRVALGILIAALAGSCGGDDDALNKEQYAAKLNAMCENFSEKEREIGEPRTPADLVEKGPRVLEAFEETIVDEVHDLRAPDEIAPQANRLTDLADQQRDLLGRLIEAAKANDFARMRELAAQNEALNKEAGSLSRQLGAEACA